MLRDKPAYQLILLTKLPKFVLCDSEETGDSSDGSNGVTAEVRIIMVPVFWTLTNITFFVICCLLF